MPKSQLVTCISHYPVKLSDPNEIYSRTFHGLSRTNCYPVYIATNFGVDSSRHFPYTA